MRYRVTADEQIVPVPDPPGGPPWFPAACLGFGILLLAGAVALVVMPAGTTTTRELRRADAVVTSVEHEGWLNGSAAAASETAFIALLFGAVLLLALAGLNQRVQKISTPAGSLELQPLTPETEAAVATRVAAELQRRDAVDDPEVARAVAIDAFRIARLEQAVLGAPAAPAAADAPAAEPGQASRIFTGAAQRAAERAVDLAFDRLDQRSHARAVAQAQRTEESTPTGADANAPLHEDDHGDETPGESQHRTSDGTGREFPEAASADDEVEPTDREDTAAAEAQSASDSPGSFRAADSGSTS